MGKNLRFCSNVTLIALAHVALIVGLIRWSRESKAAGAQSVVWMNGGGGDGIVERKNALAPVKSALPHKESKTEALKEHEPDEDRPYLASAPSEIQLPAPKPSPKPTPTATPARSPKPSPTAKAKTTPKPTPKSTPKPSPKKITLAKASPKPSPAVKPTPEKTENEQAGVATEKKEIVKALPAKNDSGEKESKKSPATQTGSGKGTAPGSRAGRGGGAGRES